MPRYKYLDTSRGLAAILVLAYHVGPRNNLFASAAYFAVNYFFVLSGFVLANSIMKVKNGLSKKREFVHKRYLRLFSIVVPVLFAAFVSETVQKLIENNKNIKLANPPFDGKNFLGFILACMLFQIISNSAHSWYGPFWSLSVEWWVNLLAIAIPKKNLLFSCYTLTFIGFFLILSNPNEADQGFGAIGRGLSGFFLGIVFRLQLMPVVKISRLDSAIKNLIFFLSSGAIGIAILNLMESDLRLVLTFIFCFGCIYALVRSENPQHRSNKGVNGTTLGALSFGIYAWHMLIASWTNAIFKSIIDSSTVYESDVILTSRILITLLVSLALANFSLRIIEPRAQKILNLPFR